MTDIELYKKGELDSEGEEEDYLVARHPEDFFDEHYYERIRNLVRECNTELFLSYTLERASRFWGFQEINFYEVGKSDSGILARILRPSPVRVELTRSEYLVHIFQPIDEKMRNFAESLDARLAEIYKEESK